MSRLIPLGCFSRVPKDIYPITRLNIFIDEENEMAKQNLPDVDCIDLVARVNGIKKIHILKMKRDDNSNSHIPCKGSFTTHQ